MKNLILKDLLLIKGNAKALPLLFVGFMFMLFNNVMAVSFILPFFCVTLAMSTFGYDDYNKWDAYAITLPGGKNKVVQSKYIFTVLLLLVGTIISFIITAITLLIKDNLQLEQLLGMIVGGFSGTIVVISIIYPIIYKFGSEKGRIITFVGIFGISLLAGLILEKIQHLDINLSNILNFINQFWYILLPIVLLTIFSISCKISERIYEKKEF